MHIAGAPMELAQPSQSWGVDLQDLWIDHVVRVDSRSARNAVVVNHDLESVGVADPAAGDVELTVGEKWRWQIDTHGFEGLSLALVCCHGEAKLERELAALKVDRIFFGGLKNGVDHTMIR